MRGNMTLLGKVLALCLSILFSGLSACVPTHEKPDTAPPSKAVVEDRGIPLAHKMRQEAVSRRIGRWAVVIGISNYKYDTHRDPVHGIPDLRYANRDARAFSEFLLSPEGGAFSPDHVLTLTDEAATIKEVRKAIGDFLAQSLEEDLVILFYAGHGVPDPRNPKNLYLLCYDTEPGNYYGTALPMWEIDVALSRTVRSKRVFVFADACHSAGVGGTRAISASDRFNEYMERLAGSKDGVTKITASRANELSQEKAFREGGHGVFTYYLLKGLRGEADDNADGFVTMKEAFDYLYDRVRSETRHSQNPWSSAYVSADIPLGIVDQQVLAAIKARIETLEKRPAPSVKAFSSSPPSIEVPEDSAVAVRLARAKLAKDEAEKASALVDGVLARNDQGKPDALALKIEILLHQGNLKGAEDIEDLLVIPYPDHPAARKGAQRIYRHYLDQVEGTAAGKQIRQIETYLRRHPSGLLEQDAKAELSGIRAKVTARYEKAFQEHLILTKGFIDRNRFERARKELSAAGNKADEAMARFGIMLEKQRIAELRLLTDERERKHRDDRFRASFAKAQEQFQRGYCTAAHQSLDQARTYATPEQLDEIDALASQYNAPPEVKIALKTDTIDWETPVQFKYEAEDKEADPVRAVSWDFGDGTVVEGESPEHAYTKWTGAERERTYRITLRATDGHSIVTTTKTITVKKQDRIKTFTIKGVSFRMVRIPAGDFLMGSPENEKSRDSDEGPQHRVSLDGFWIGETEVTQGLWKAVMGSNPSYFKNCGNDCPVENVSWNECKEFIQKLNQILPGHRFRLPTEAEWEYACRAGSTTRFYFGDDENRLGEYAWYTGNSQGRTHPVKQKKPNAWGLYDMSGNVWEWCEDIYSSKAYSKHQRNNPIYTLGGSLRVIRGGSWDIPPRLVRCAYRSSARPGYTSPALGFRLVRTR